MRYFDVPLSMKKYFETIQKVGKIPSDFYAVDVKKHILGELVGRDNFISFLVLDNSEIIISQVYV